MISRAVTILVFLLTSVLQTFSQSNFFAVKGGLNIAGASTDLINDDLTMKPSYHIGIVGNLRLNTYWVLQPEILYSNEGFNTSTKLNNRYNLTYVNLPILFKYQYKNFFFDFGPQFGLLFGASIVDLDTKKRKNINSQFNTLSWAIATGLGVMATDRLGVEGRVTLAFKNDSSDPAIDYFNNVFQLSFFYVISK